MAQNRSNSNKHGEPSERDGVRRKRIRVEPTRRKKVDPDMIALCYWLIAQRIVQEADDANDVAEQRDAATASDNARPSDGAATGADS